MSPAGQPDRSSVLQAALSASSRITAQASWDRYSSLGAGSAPFFLVEPANVSDARCAIGLAYTLGRKVFPLGNGTNLVGSDTELSDLLFLKLPLHSQFGKMELQPDGTVCAGAACSLLSVIRFAAEHSLGGASALCGIPGTLGGALAMNAGAMGKSLSDFLVSSRGFPQLFEMVFALFAALYFIIVALSFYTGRQAYVSARVLSLMPVCWLMCRLISRFVRAVSFIHVSELFWELVMIVFLMLFFMGFARLMSGIGKEGKLPLTMGAGLCGAMVAFMVSLSRIITYFVAGEDYLSADSPIELCDFGAALVAIMFLLSCVHDLSPKADLEPADKPAPAPAQPVPDAKTEKQKKDEEAFLIAEQYANRYIIEEEPEEASIAKDSKIEEPTVFSGGTQMPADLSSVQTKVLTESQPPEASESDTPSAE